jgi:two-component system, NarL family, response regulator NreC
MNIKILLADDHRIMREGLRSILEKQKDFEIVAEVDNGKSAVQLAEKHTPDVIIMDITMPDLNGIEATKRIKEIYSVVKIIGLSVHADKRFISKMYEAGANGYLRKDCASEELILAIRTVMKGQTYISPSIANIIVDEFLAPHKSQKIALTESHELSTKEKEILQLLAEGKSMKEIAYKLGISDKTVHHHRKHIMLKLKIECMADLVKYAIKEGIITIE